MRNILFGKAFKYYFIFSILWLAAWLLIMYINSDQSEGFAEIRAGMIPSFPGSGIIFNAFGLKERLMNLLIMFFFGVLINASILSSFFFLFFKIKKYIFSRGQ